MSAALQDDNAGQGQGPNVEQEARELGWVPKDEWRGDQAKWVPADEFVERGHVVMPILKKNNERLLQTQQSLQTQVEQLRRELEAAKNDFQTLQEFHKDEVTRRVEETKRNLLERIKQAKTEGDVDTEVELTDQLQDLKAANKAAEKHINGADTVDEGSGGGEQQMPPNPAYDAWVSANNWFQTDPERTHEALAVGFRITKEMPHLRKEAFFEELDRRLNKGNGAGRPGPGKVEGSRGGRTQGGTGGGRTYSDLPAEAKAQCDKYAKRFVNPSGQFKTEADYRKHFIQQLETTGYFE